MVIMEPFLTAEAIREHCKRGPEITRLLREADKLIESAFLTGRTYCEFGTAEVGIVGIIANDLRARGFTVSERLDPTSRNFCRLEVFWGGIAI